MWICGNLRSCLDYGLLKSQIRWYFEHMDLLVSICCVLVGGDVEQAPSCPEEWYLFRSVLKTKPMSSKCFENEHMFSKLVTMMNFQRAMI